MGKVIVTGGAGFIGSHLAEELSKKFEVLIIDNLSTGSYWKIPENVEFLEIDILDYNNLLGSFENAKYVFHQAALPSVPRSIENPIASHRVNSEGTLNILRAAKEHDIEKIVFASSSSVYGDTPILPSHEKILPKPLSPYAVSKISSEYFMQVFNHLYGMKTFSLRYFNVFGPKQDPNSQYSAVVVIFIYNALLDKKIIIHGDGNQSRDFTYVADVVNANIALLDVDKGYGKTYNFASGNSITLNELADNIIQLTNSNSELMHGEERAGDIKHSMADVNLYHELTGNSAKLDIEAGLKLTIDWMKNNLDKFS